MYEQNICNKVKIEEVVKLLSEDNKILTNELLKKEWKKKIKEDSHFTTGHCYAACEAIYYMYGGNNFLTPQVIKFDNGDTHWFLKNKFSNEIYDPTAQQFKEKINYESAKGCGFQQQSFRSLEIMKRLLKKLNIEESFKIVNKEIKIKRKLK